jgi:hypothetical protein
MPQKSRSGNQYIEPPAFSNGSERPGDNNSKMAVILWDESERPIRLSDEPAEISPPPPRQVLRKTRKHKEKQS